MSHAKTWAYWLQHPNLEELAQYPADLVVIDYSADGSKNREFTRQQIDTLKKSGKTVLCYFSIGEAETYRFYWGKDWHENPPSFLGAENPDWPENYKVRYWEQSWKEEVLKPYMDKILSAGFDGVYLDIIDAFWYWHEQDGRDLKKSSDDMIRLVLYVANYCRHKAGSNFLVVPQNGLSVIANADPGKRTAYLQTIDAVGVESLYYNYFTPEDQTYRFSLLKTYANNDIPTFLIEYIDEDQYRELASKVAQAPFPIVAYVGSTDKALDHLSVNWLDYQ